MKKSLLILLVILIVFSVPFAAGIASLGVTPPIVELTYSKDSMENLQFTILSPGEDWVRIYVQNEGGLKNGSIAFKNINNTNKVYITGRKDVLFDVELEPEEAIPGDHKYLIYIEQTDPPADSEGNPYERPPGITARAAVGYVLKIFVPYKEKFLVFGFSSATNAKLNGKAYFKFSVQNRGQQGISNLAVDVDILDKDGVKVGSTKTQPVELAPLEEKTLTAEWDTGKNGVGRYEAVATANYDGEKREAKKVFFIGDIEVGIDNIQLNMSQNIAKAAVTVSSRWNEIIDDVYLTLNIKNKKGAVVDTVNSETFSLKPWEAQTKTLFFEKNKLPYGIYKAEITASYAGRTSSKEVEFYHTSDAIVEKPASMFTVTNLLLTVISLLLFFLIVVILIVLLKYTPAVKAGKGGKAGGKRSKR